jgi:hypothetical protein
MSPHAPPRSYRTAGNQEADASTRRAPMSLPSYRAERRSQSSGSAAGTAEHGGVCAYPWRRRKRLGLAPRRARAARARTRSGRSRPPEPGRVGRLVGVHGHRRPGVGDRSDLVVVGHSLGGFPAPLVCARLPATLLVLVAAMISPRPASSSATGGETAATRRPGTRTSSTTTSLPRSQPRRGGENATSRRRR